MIFKSPKMNTQLLSAGPPKPGFNATFDSLQSNISLGRGETFLKEGSDNLTISPAQLVNGICVCHVGSSGTITIPVSSDIDEYLSNSNFDESSYFIFKVVSRTDSDVTFSSDDQAGCVIPRRQAAGRNTSTEFYFVRVNGLWQCVNA